jgi:uncharacterized protein YndB with AHSA1/START domain
MKNICTIEIEASITKVFDFINDASKHKLWLEGLEDTVREPGYDPKNPLGSKFQQKIRDGKKVEVYDGEVTAFARPRHLGARVYNKAISVQIDYQLTKVKKHTLLEFTSQVTFHNLALKMVAGLGLSRSIMRGILEKQMTSLKQLIEAET